MIELRNYGLLIGLIILVGLARPAAAFGAGNIASISKVEGQNWRHGDIEDALLTLTMARAWHGKKFNKLMVSRTYFGNWLRDYSQAIDVGTVKSVSAEAIRLLLCILGFLTFGFGSGEFEVTADRLGCYRPEDHIDNPKDYAENEDARQYDRRLRGPIDERRELSIDPETGMKNYIANENAGIMTSGKHVRSLFGRCIELGRRYKDRGDKKDLYEALRLMGTGLHCLEDFFAHSNYCELVLIEMGEENVFPHVGRDTKMEIDGARGPVYPVVTGTFGGVDFLHSVTGEVSDKMTQNEIQELEGTLQESQNADTSMLRDLLDKIPDGFFGDKNQSEKIDQIQTNAAQSQVQNMSVSPREPEEFTRYIQEVFQQVMPAIEFHDDVMKSITAAVEKIPVLPKIIEQLEEQLSVFVFSIIAPFIVPLIDQIQAELKTGSDEIINSSEKEQHIVFNDDRSTDPTHSMLSKDHFSNILNEIAGRGAASMVHWVVPQLMDAIDNEDTDVDRLLDTVVNGIMHHPAQRGLGGSAVKEGRIRCFKVVKEWWNEMGQDQQRDYRQKLTREGVKRGENHKEGVHDTGHGHGCTGKLKMRKLYGEPQTFEDKIAGVAADAIFQGATGAISGMVEESSGYKLPQQQKRRDDDGPLGGLLSGGGGGGGGGLGGLLGAAGSLLGGFGEEEKPKERSHRKQDSGDNRHKKSRENSRHREHSRHRDDDGSERRTEREYGHSGNTYDQSERTETRYPDGRSESQYNRYEQQESNSGRETSGFGYEERTQTRPTEEGYESRTERREYGGSNEQQYGGGGGGGGYGREESNYGGGGGGYGQGGNEGGYGGGGGGYGQGGNEGGYGGGGGYGQGGNEGGYGGGGGGYGQGGNEGRGEAASYGGGGGEGGYGRQEGGYGDDSEQQQYGRRSPRRDEGGYGGGYGGGGGY